ncbi:MAG TPA: hypothetical protein VJ574_00880, partial [Candidatus Bathyarchaeia archaeon]|nr:hypothetical protein [Candidatus Bathyarchaeia archaeon]
MGDGLGSITEHLAAQVPQWHTLKLGNRPGVSMRYISGSLGNRLAIHPIPGEFYGSAQYMGAQPGQAVIFMAITDPDILAEIHAMKYANQRMTTLGVRHWRRPELHIRNPILNLMGIWTAQIENIQTTTVSPNTTEVTISLIEHRVDPKSREAITRPLLFSQETIKRALKFLFKHAQNHVRDRQLAVNTRTLHPEVFAGEEVPLEALNAQRVKEGKPQLSGPRIRSALSSKSLEGRQHQKTAFQLLFGDNGILAPSVVGDAFFISERSKTDQNPAGAFIAQQIKTQYLLDTNLSPDKRADVIIARWGGRSAHAGTEKVTKITIVRSREERIVSNATIGDIPIIVVPTDAELDYLAAHLVRSGGNITDRIEIHPSDTEGELPLLQTREGLDKTADIVSLMTLAQAILHNKVRPPGEEGLRTLVLGKGTTLQSFLSTIKEEPSFLYADLHLPTYGQALLPIIQAIQIKRIHTQEEANPEEVKPIESFSQLSQEEQALIRNFVPTYRQIGKIPTESRQSLDDLAYDVNDTVLPDFPFYSRHRDDLFRFMENAADTKSREGEDKLKKKQTDLAGEKPPHDPLSQFEIQKLFDENRHGEERPSQTAKGTALANLTFENRDILLTEAYGPARHRATFDDFGTIEQARNVAAAASAQEEDSHLSLRKCFPTLRLFFIEERTRAGTWKAIDDV